MVLLIFESRTYLRILCLDQTLWSSDKSPGPCSEDLGFQLLEDVNIVLGEGNGTPLEYSCLGNPMDRGAQWAAVHGAAKRQTRLSD